MKKRIGQKGFSSVIILILIIVVAVVGFTGWYVWDSNKTDKQESNIVQNNHSATKTTPTPSLSLTATPTTKSPSAQALEQARVLDSLKAFCLDNDSNGAISRLVYVETENDIYANCTVTDTESMAGMHIIAYYNRGEWVSVWAGNGIMDPSLCSQYRIPSAIYADCHN